jgi:uncharacterized protein YutE (UPF0331/DUF86 family)
VDRRLIEEKLESLRSCVRRIEVKCPETTQALLSDPDLQDIIALNITRAVQLCVDIAAHIVAETEQRVPDTMSGLFDVLAESDVISAELSTNMKNAVGFRNIAVHAYQIIDWTIVFGICKERLQDFQAFARAIAGYLE